MRDRLIELLETDVECNKDGHGDCSMCEYKYADDKCAHYLSNIIADFLLANGVIVPPCKVGQTVYIISDFTHEILDRLITEIIIKKDGYGFVFDTRSSWSDTDIGKTVFLTKELAEKALAERSGK